MHPYHIYSHTHRPSGDRRTIRGCLKGSSSLDTECHGRRACLGQDADVPGASRLQKAAYECGKRSAHCPKRNTRCICACGGTCLCLRMSVTAPNEALEVNCNRMTIKSLPLKRFPQRLMYGSVR